MKKILFLMLLSGAVIADANAADTSASNAQATGAQTPVAKDAEHETFGMLYDLSSQMLGHTAMARDAIAFGLYNGAADNITLAQKEASDLVAQTPQFNAQFAPRKSAKGNNTANADYLFPVMDNTVYLQDIDIKHPGSPNSKAAVADAETANYMLFINTKQASDALNQAAADVKELKYDDALLALNNVGNGAVLAAEAYDTPLEAARDNMLLAREMVRNKQYKGASYALGHAKDELSRAEKADTKLADSADVKNLQQQISDLQNTLSQKNPSFAEKTETKIEGWIHDIESHLHKNS